MRKGRITFNSSPEPTIGVEVELQILDKHSLDLTSGAVELLKFYEGNNHVKEELLDSIIEINTGICRNISEVKDDLVPRLRDVIKTADTLGYALSTIATHPYSRWKEQSVTQSERYQHFVNRMQWPLRRLLITGLHVHIGVDSGEKAIAVTNGLTRYIPHMIALSANSPIYDSEITGLASTRTKIFEGLPTAGLPHLLRNYSEFQKYIRTLQKANTIESIREVWWDIRPHPGFGTVEIRVFDSVPKVDEMLNLAALTQCLVVGIADHYDDGTQLPLLDNWVIAENKWRATRYGLDGDIIIDNKGHQQSIKSAIYETVDSLLPLSRKLGCESQLLNIIEQTENNMSPYQRQLRIYDQSQDFNEILLDSVKQLKDSVNLI
jgi:glutamate---cysteine ligase / carboxylate-amine ligase